MEKERFWHWFLVKLALIFAAMTLNACAAEQDFIGRIAYQRVLSNNSQIFMMDPTGENKTRLTQEAGWHFMPSWAPDGKKIAFYSYDPQTELTMVYAVKVDPMASNQVPLTGTGSPNSQFGPLKWSPDGLAILFYTLDTQNIAAIMKIDLETSTMAPALGESGYFDFSPDWSPDGTQFVFSSNRPVRDDPIYDLYLADAQGENLTRLTDNRQSGWVDTLPAWSPDGERIAFWRYNYIPGAVFSGGPQGIWLYHLASGEESLLVEAQIAEAETPPAWSPNGKYLAFLEGKEGQHVLRVLDVDTGKLRSINDVPGNKRVIAWSPDSRSLVFMNYGEAETTMAVLDIHSGRMIVFKDPDLSARIGDPAWGGK